MRGKGIISMAELANCVSCGKVYAKHIKDICEECFKQEEKDFDTVYRFLRERKNREATLQKIVEKTGVTENVIITFIKNKRLRTSQFPKLAYPCEQCGTDIVTGKICEDCTNKIMLDLESYQEEEKKRKAASDKANVYYSMGKDKR